MTTSNISRSLLLLIVLVATNINGLTLRLPNRIATIMTGILISSAHMDVSQAASATSTYVNERYHTEIQYPSNWVSKVSVLPGDRTVQAFIDPDDADTSVSLVFTPIPADFNRISAFGNLREYMIPKGDDATTEVISETTKGERYTLEYVIGLPEGITRHIQTVFALRPQESVVGVTVQTREENFIKNKELLSGIVPSLKINLD
jgi:hypothetical protein